MSKGSICDKMGYSINPLADKTLNNIRGFGLLELLLSLSVLAILLALALPAMRDFSADRRAMTQINSLGRMLYYARSEAILRGEKTVICPSSNGQSCAEKWRDGQIVIDSNNEVLRLFPALPKPDKLIWNSSGGKDSRLEWLPTGYTNGQRGTFYYCSLNAANSRTLVLLDTGRWYVADMTEYDFQKFCV